MHLFHPHAFPEKYELIKRAKLSVDIATYSISVNKEWLLNTFPPGPAYRLIIHRDTVGAKPMEDLIDVYTSMIDARIDISIRFQEESHVKCIILDNNRLIFGSANFIKPEKDPWYEFMMETTDPDEIQTSINVFNQMWNDCSYSLKSLSFSR